MVREIIMHILYFLTSCYYQPPTLMLDWQFIIFSATRTSEVVQVVTKVCDVWYTFSYSTYYSTYLYVHLHNVEMKKSLARSLETKQLPLLHYRYYIIQLI